MANASGKRIAAQNEAYLKNLRIGLVLANLSTFLLRLILRRSLVPALFPLIMYSSTLMLTIALYSHFAAVGTPRRDAKGVVVGSGEDLGASGLFEWGWDLIYVTWACAVLSSISSKAWYLYLIVPGFAIYKIALLVLPFLGFFKRSTTTEEPVEPVAAGGKEKKVIEEGMSNRQAKLKARAERGDGRVKAKRGGGPGGQ